MEFGQVLGNKEKIVITSKEDIEGRLCQCLKNHELPDYFLYMGTGGAKNWLKLDGAKTFPVARQLKILMEKKSGLNRKIYSDRHESRKRGCGKRREGKNFS